jgi:hypothetical protein
MLKTLNNSNLVKSKNSNIINHLFKNSNSNINRLKSKTIFFPSGLVPKPARQSEKDSEEAAEGRHKAERHRVSRRVRK